MIALSCGHYFPMSMVVRKQEREDQILSRVKEGCYNRVSKWQQTDFQKYGDGCPNKLGKKFEWGNSEVKFNAETTGPAYKS